MSTRPTDAQIIHAVTTAKQYWIARGIEFKTVAEAQRDNYAHFTDDDKVKALLVTSRAAVMLDAQFPDAQIGLEAYAGVSGKSIPGSGSDETFSYQMIIVGRSGPWSNQILRSGVEPDSSWHYANESHTEDMLHRDWRKPFTVDEAPAHLITRPVIVPPLPPTTTPEVIAKVDRTTVTRAQLRKWRGAIATTLWDDASGIRPGREDNALFTAEYMSPAYDAAARARMRRAYPYSHWALNPLVAKGYHSYWPDTDWRGNMAEYQTRVDELWNDGAIPVPFLLDDTGIYTDGRTVNREAIERDLTPLYSQPWFQERCKIVVNGWEHEYNEADWRWVCQWMARVFPHALRYIHLPSEVEIVGADAVDKAASWRAVAPFIHGVLTQYTYTFLGDLPDSSRTPEEQVRAFAALWVSRFRDGHGGWPTVGADGEPLDVVMFEYGSYALFHGGPGRFETWKNVSLASIEMGRQLLTIAGIAGVGDGCPVATSTPTPPTPPTLPPHGETMSLEHIAHVVAGLFFERIAEMLHLPGTDVAQRRPAVHQWITDRVLFLDAAYRRVFGRPVDPEGVGSRILLALSGKTDAEIEAVLVESYNNGAR